MTRVHWRTLPPRVDFYALVGGTFDVAPMPEGNLYDTAVIMVDALIRGPGVFDERPCFWMIDVPEDGSPHWTFRYLARVEGAHRVQIRVRTAAGTTTSRPQTFVVNPLVTARARR